MTNSAKYHLPENWVVVVARDLEEIEAIRAVWKEVQRKEPYPTINADINRYLSIVKARQSNAQPHVILLQRDGHHQAMVIGRIEKISIEGKIGYKTLLKPTLRCLSVVYGGVIGQLTDEVCDMVVQVLLDTLVRGEADVVFLNHIKNNSAIHRYSRIKPRMVCRSFFTKVHKHWIMDIPNSMDQFYQTLSAKHRSTLRRKIRILGKKYPNQVNMVTYTQEADLDEAIEAASKVSRTTYQYALGCGLKDTSGIRVMLSTAAQNGWLRLSVLYVDKEPCAFQVGLRYGKKYFLDTLGFNPKWKKLSVGTVLFFKVLENLCNDNELETFDFGFGGARYKRDYGNKHWHEASVYIFAPRFRMMCLNLLYSALSGLSLGLNYFSDKIGFARWLKRCWRNHLQGNENQEENEIRE